ncbi:MAG TPA: hypothetical protein VKX39_14680, partial [Bryobacteraceae bacterium]|nr:hypothetical protein [Bryobacteraceae bacterium]
MVFRILAISFLVSIAGAQPKPASDAPVYRFHYASIMDDPAHIGGEAYHILAPADWHVTGGVIWKADPALPAAAWARLFGSGGREIGALPSNVFVWNPRMFGRNFPPGSTYAGSEVQPPALDPLQCIQRVVIPRYRHNLAGARIVKQEPLPELAQAGRLKYPEPEYRNAMFQAGKVRFEYVENGVEMEEDVYVLTSAVQFSVGPTTSTVWAADEVRYSRAPKGVLDSQVPLFETAMFSMKPNLRWWAKMQKVAQMLAQQQIQASN